VLNLLICLFQANTSPSFIDPSKFKSSTTSFNFYEPLMDYYFLTGVFFIILILSGLFLGYLFLYDNNVKKWFFEENKGKKQV
jgi:hypothetical protein